MKSIFLKILLLWSFSVAPQASPTIDEIILGTQLKGLASYYGPRFHGKRTANGEIMNKNAYTCAHKTLPFGTMLEVYNPRTNAYVILRVNDRGPYSGTRIIDVSEIAAKKLGMVQKGVVEVIATVVGFNGDVYMKRASVTEALVSQNVLIPKVKTPEQLKLLERKRSARKQNGRKN